MTEEFEEESGEYPLVTPGQHIKIPLHFFADPDPADFITADPDPSQYGSGPRCL